MTPTPTSRPADPRAAAPPTLPPLKPFKRPAQTDAPTPPPTAPTLPETQVPALLVGWDDDAPVPAGPPGFQPWEASAFCSPAAASAESAPAVERPTAMEMDRADEPRQLGQYRLLALIGEGGMGRVYKAEDIYLKRTVALKVMRPDVAKDELGWKLFWNEARATAALQSERIATVYQVGEEAGTMFLAMELLRGESLETRLENGPLTLVQALWVVREAALGLAVAHRAGFVHRDIKPANLWLEAPDGQAQPRSDPLGKFREGLGAEPADTLNRLKLLDFGLVRIDCDDEGRMKRGAIVGTPAYMAPEQAAGELGDARSDLFSLGVVLFRLLTGKLPFPGESALEIMTALATETAPPASQFQPNLPPTLVDLIQRVLSRDPVARPRSAVDVAEELMRIEEELSAPPPAPPSTIRWWYAAVPAALVLGVGAALWLSRATLPAEVEAAPSSVPAEAVFAPHEVLKRVGDRVTVEFVVKAVLRTPAGGMYLTANAADADEFRVVLSGETQTELRSRGYTKPEHLAGAKVRIHGTLVRDDRFTVLQVAGVDQFHKLLPRTPVVPPKEAPHKSEALPPTVPKDEFDDPDASARALLDALDEFSKAAVPKSNGNGGFLPGKGKR